MKALHMIAFTLLVIGGLNWGIVGATFGNGMGGVNVVHMILKNVSWLEMLIYILVGLSAIFEAVTHKHNCRCCNMDNKPAM